jgi:hypothetical protein
LYAPRDPVASTDTKAGVGKCVRSAISSKGQLGAQLSAVLIVEGTEAIAREIGVVHPYEKLSHGYTEHHVDRGLDNRPLRALERQ